MSLRQWTTLNFQWTEKDKPHNKILGRSQTIFSTGDEENLVRFLHAYCESINTILARVIYNQPRASQLAFNDTLKSNPAVQDLLDIKCLSFEESIDICHEPTPKENKLSEPHETPSNTTAEAL